MRNRLVFFCDTIIEAGWLSALIIVPLFFNLHSGNIFEPDKVPLLRSIALAMGMAWVIKELEKLRTRQGTAGVRLASFWQPIYKTPLVLPALLLVSAYVISTALSVAPRISLLGSFRRMQGTYTMLSYIVIFFLTLQGLRTMRQMNRLITVSILVSFPVAMYGLLQHFGMDPLPWGSETSKRAISTIGNSIFLAAYLIMVVPLTFSRLLENWRKATGGLNALDLAMGGTAAVITAGTLLGVMFIHLRSGAMWVHWLAVAAAVGFQAAICLFLRTGRHSRVPAISLPLTFAFLLGFSWTFEIIHRPSTSNYLWLGLLVAIIFMPSMAALAWFLRKPISRLLLLGGYFIILVSQLTCIFYTQSRGPMMGLLAGGFFYFGLLGLIKRKAWISWIVSGLAIAVIVFLVIFNTVRTPLLESLHKTPYVGRLGNISQTWGTGRNRLLIWKGVVNMIDRHPPLEYPGEDGGPDALNALRPFIGYGPEAMYLSYNRFYPPELAHQEQRRLADRSHNETFDTLASTGAFGFLVYMFLCTGVFYYGLRWLGLIRKRVESLAFLGLWVGGGIVGGIGAWFRFEPLYMGIGVPGGLILGLVMYVFISMVRLTFHPGTRQSSDGNCSLWMLALVSAMVAHFIEIHIGIAVAATRLYFWTYAAMMVVIGARRVSSSGETPPTNPEKTTRANQKTSGAVSPQTPGYAAGEQHRQGSFLFFIMAALLILGTMFFDFITVRDNSPLLTTIWDSLTKNRGHLSLGILALFLATWGMISVIALNESATREESDGKAWNRPAATGIFVSVSLAGSLIFALLHTALLRWAMTARPEAAAGTITFYCIFVFLVLLALTLSVGFLLHSPVKLRHWTFNPGEIGIIAAGMTLSVAVGLLIVGNINIIRADIFSKQGQIFEERGKWDGAIFFYDKAIKIEKNQDYYYMSLAQACLGKGKSIAGQSRDIWFREAEKALFKAMKISPLDPVHSTNLARLYTTWGEVSKGTQRSELLEKALTQYAAAGKLSPNNAQVYNEWGKTFLVLGNTEKANEMYQKSLSLDSRYQRTYIFLGQLYIAQKKWAEAAEAFQQSLKFYPKRVDGYIGAGYVHVQMGELEAARQSYQKALKVSPKDFRPHMHLAILYQKMGNTAEAVSELKKALALAPDENKPALQTFLDKLRTLQ